MEIVLPLQLQMEKLPSRSAISEMIGWMNAVEPQAAGEDTELSQRSAAQVKNLLQKLKVIRAGAKTFSLNTEARHLEGKGRLERPVR